MVNKWAEYERQKQEFLRDNPKATPRQIEMACREIARKLRI